MFGMRNGSNGRIRPMALEESCRLFQCTTSSCGTDTSSSILPLKSPRSLQGGAIQHPLQQMKLDSEMELEMKFGGCGGHCFSCFGRGGGRGGRIGTRPHGGGEGEWTRHPDVLPSRQRSSSPKSSLYDILSGRGCPIRQPCGSCSPLGPRPIPRMASRAATAERWLPRSNTHAPTEADEFGAGDGVGDEVWRRWWDR